MPPEGLDVSTGKKGLTEAQKGLSLVKLSKEQEEVEPTLWRPQKKREVHPTLDTGGVLEEGSSGPKEPCWRIHPSQNQLSSQVGIKSETFLVSLSFYAKNVSYLEKHVFVEFSDISFFKTVAGF